MCTPDEVGALIDGPVAIPDSKFTATSSFDEYLIPAKIRLNLCAEIPIGCAWTAGGVQTGEYIEV